MSQILFKGGRGEYGPLSNFYIIRDGVGEQLSDRGGGNGLLLPSGRSVRSSEHAYQAAAFEFEGAPEANFEFAREIVNVQQASFAKMYGGMKTSNRWDSKDRYHGNKIKAYIARGIRKRPRWYDVKADVMRSILKHKFRQSPKCRAVLLSTGEKCLMENNRTDAFWGIGEDGKGKNTLGKILMEIREQIRNE